MTCELCKKNRATLYKMHGGRSVAVCSACLHKPSTITTFKVTSFGIGDGFIQINKSVTNFNPSITNLHQQSVKRNIVCPNCAHDLGKFKSTSKLGCSECYKTFKDDLAPIIRNIHGVVT